MTDVTGVTGNTIREPAPRIVKPRTRRYTRRPVIAVDGDMVVSEQGESSTVNDLIAALPTMQPTLFATVGSADFVAQLNVTYSLAYPNTWNWRVSTHEREIVRPDGVRVAARLSVVVHYFGWKGGSYHKIIDPVVMYGHKLDNVWPGTESRLSKLLKWAIAVRDFCDGEGIDVKPTGGGIASQFLTDPRFYPKARRKVPVATNERVREQLPGNHYFLNVTASPKRNYRAYYLDQRRAHHHHARTTRLPSSDTLYAYGRFRDLSGPVFESTSDNFIGLYCLDLEFSRIHAGRSFCWLRTGEHELTKQFVYSNELPHLLDMGFRVTGVRAAWGSRHPDTCIAKYATWAGDTLDNYNDAPWLKPILLATYGVLATRPKYAESVFRLAKKGELVSVHTGRNKLTGMFTQSAHKLEPRIGNVLQRGMIEAATRSESVGLAQWLNSRGHQILSIYADAVMVTIDDDRPLPLLPEPWRLKTELNHLQFISQQAFMSGEMTKLPGVGRELLKYRQATPGVAPTRKLYDALTGDRVKTSRKI